MSDGGSTNEDRVSAQAHERLSFLTLPSPTFLRSPMELTGLRVLELRLKTRRRHLVHEPKDVVRIVARLDLRILSHHAQYQGHVDERRDVVLSSATDFLDGWLAR